MLISFVSVCVFNVQPKTTLLPVWPRDAQRLDTPAVNYGLAFVNVRMKTVIELVFIKPVPCVIVLLNATDATGFKECSL